MNKLYFIAYNPAADFNYTGLHQCITQNLYPKVVTDWWHHITYGYIVASNHDANQLYNLIYPSIPGKFFMVVEINPNNTQGWLPVNAWNWISKYRNK